MKTVNHIRFILILLVIFSFSKGSYGQERDTCKIYFAQNSSYIVSDYLGNKESIAMLKSMLATPRTIDTIYINVYSSPEGQLRTNEWLTERRANRLSDFVLRHSGGKIDPGKIKIQKVPEHWEGLISAIEQNYHGKYRDAVLDILYDDSLTNHKKKLAIKYLDTGKTWTFFIQEYMPALRFADEIILVRKLDLPQMQQNIVEEVVVKSELKPSEIRPRQVPQEVLPVVSEPDNFLFSARTNLVYDLAMVPNLGLEFHLGKRFSLGVNYAHAWWANDAAHRYWRIYGGDVVFRKYFGGNENWSALSGHHLGAYGQCYSYDFELGKKGQLSEMTYGGGLEYGYTLPLSRCMSLDFSLGCAYLTGEYKVYEPEDECYVWKETRQRHYIGPKKAEISFVWLFGNRKGGAR